MKSYTFDQLSITAQNNAYCNFLGCWDFDDKYYNATKETFAELMQNDNCFDVNGECLDIEDDNY